MPASRHGLEEFFCARILGQGRKGRVPFVKAVVFEDHRGHTPPTGDDARLDALDPARNRRMHRGADEAVRRADLLSQIYPLARLDQRPCRARGVLEQRNCRQRRRGNGLDGLCSRGALFSDSLMWMHAAAKSQCLAQCTSSPIFRAPSALYMILYTQASHNLAPTPSFPPFRRFGKRANAQYINYYMAIIAQVRAFEHINFNKIAA